MIQLDSVKWQQATILLLNRGVKEKQSGRIVNDIKCAVAGDIKQI